MSTNRELPAISQSARGGDGSIRGAALALCVFVVLAQFAMGVALADLQQWGKAIEHLHTAIELQPDSAWAHYYMGNCLVKTGDYKSAAVHLEIASSRLPEFAAGHLLLADAYGHLGRPDDAKRERAKVPAKP